MNLFSRRLLDLLPWAYSGSGSPAVSEERRETRLSIAAYEYPRTLVWAAGVLLLMTVITSIGELTHDNSGHSLLTHINDVLVAIVLLTTAWVLHTEFIPREQRAWVFAIPAVLLIWSLLWQVTIEGSALNYTYAMFVLIGFGPTSLAAKPYLVGAGLTVGAAILLAIYGPIGQAADWIIVSLTAAGIGAILLRIRLQSIISLADATALAKELATQDQLTGTLNRHGLLEHLPDLWATAGRFNEGVFVAFIDIRGLKRANDRFGHDYGDSLILAAAEKAQACLRGGDLLARWGGDEFIVVGIGTLDDAERFARALGATGSDDEISSQMGGLSIGLAAGSPGRDSIEDLTSRADEDMYRRRTLDESRGDQ